MTSVITFDSGGTNCLPKMCRLCMREQYLEDVFSENDMHQWISNYLSITIFSVDSKGHSICTFCRLRLTEFHQYWTRCQQVQTILESMVRDENESSTRLGENTELRKVKSEPFEQVYINCGAEHGEQELGSRTDTQSPVDGSSHGRFGFGLQPENTELRQDSVIDNEKESRFEIHYEEDNIQSIGKTDEIIIEQVKIEGLTDGDLLDQSDSKIHIQSNLLSVKKKSRKKSKADQQIQCNQCDKLFPDRKKLKNHMRFHKPKNHCCHICGKPFAFGSTLEKHIPLHDPNRVRKPPPDKPSLAPGVYHCDMCPKVFELKTRLWAHRTQVHRPKTHECHLCDLKFTLKSVLRRHIQKHYQDSENTGSVEKLVQTSTTSASLKTSYSSE
nr:zinc finger protein 699-like [Aedes albopictus]